MSESQPTNESTGSKVLDRLVGSFPIHYREEMARVANRIRDRLPPIMIEHRIDALEKHVDARLDQMEKKLDELLARLESR